MRPDRQRPSPSVARMEGRVGCFAMEKADCNRKYLSQPRKAIIQRDRCSFPQRWRPRSGAERRPGGRIENTETVQWYRGGTREGESRINTSNAATGICVNNDLNDRISGAAYRPPRGTQRNSLRYGVSAAFWMFSPTKFAISTAQLSQKFRYRCNLLDGASRHAYSPVSLNF
jgi:hypothetical protein